MSEIVTNDVRINWAGPGCKIVPSYIKTYPTSVCSSLIGGNILKPFQDIKTLADSIVFQNLNDSKITFRECTAIEESSAGFFTQNLKIEKIDNNIFQHYGDQTKLLVPELRKNHIDISTYRLSKNQVEEVNVNCIKNKGIEAYCIRRWDGSAWVPDEARM